MTRKSNNEVRMSLSLGDAGLVPAIVAALGAPGSLYATAIERPQSADRLAHWGGEHVLGASFDLSLLGADDGQAAVAADAALTEIARLDSLLSTWREDSEISRLSRYGRLNSSHDLYAVLAACERWRRQSLGAFDALRRAPGMSASIELDPICRGVVLPANTRLDVDALAKGYIIDRAFEVARRAAPQATGVLLDIGGDLRAWASKHAPAWTVAVAGPFAGAENAAPAQTLALRSGALAVSGLGHRSAATPIIDPRTGETIQTVLLAAGAAPTAMDADALATTLAVTKSEDRPLLFDRLQGMGGHVIETSGIQRSYGRWSGAELRLCQATSGWPDGRMLNVSFEIPTPAGGSAKRPYVAVWIADEQRTLVRTLLLLGPEARWRESNYIFWRRVERMDLPQIASIARPTRSPGRYDVVWDGRNDAGAPVPRGRYVLNIEASREHGGHSFVSLPLDLSSDTLSLTAEPSQELGVTRVAFGGRP
jgi:thiamine biosynthesis lipoprotein